VRIAVTLEDDVGARLRLEMRRTGKPLRQVLNEYLRLGFENRASARAVKKFRIRPFRAGPPAGMTFDNVEDLIDYLEGPLRR